MKDKKEISSSIIAKRCGTEYTQTVTRWADMGMVIVDTQGRIYTYHKRMGRWKFYEKEKSPQEEG